MKNGRVNAVRDAMDRAGVRKGIGCKATKPAAWRCENRVSQLDGAAFQFPLPTRRIAGRVRIDVKMRTLAAADAPPVAAERKTAVARNGPHVMKRPDQGLHPCECGQGEVAEVSAMEIVQMQDIRLQEPRIAQELPGAKGVDGA